MKLYKNIPNKIRIFLVGFLSCKIQHNYFIKLKQNVGILLLAHFYFIHTITLV